MISRRKFWRYPVEILAGILRRTTERTLGEIIARIAKGIPRGSTGARSI